MIVFDLACARGSHVFEAWFGSSDDYESQRARGLLNCPICGGSEVGKAVMAPSIGVKGNRHEVDRPTATDAVPMAGGRPGPAQIKAMMSALADAQARALDQSDYVGGRFADEARAIHLGESEQRAIHGETTPDQAKALIDEGIEVAPLPFPVQRPGRLN
jgi:hypothetical protein